MSVEPAGARGRAHLSFFLRVKAEDGRIVHEGSLERLLELETLNAVSLSLQRFVWSSHVHLRAGRYVAELAVMDRTGNRLGVRRMPVDVAPWPAALRVGSLTFLLAASGVMAGPEEDNPLRLPDLELVPMLRPTWVAGAGGALSLLAMIYPDRGLADPVSALIELHREGQLRAKTALPLPAADAEGRIRYLGGLKFTSLQPGSYVLKLVAQQGAQRAEESAVLEVSPPPVVREAK